MERQLLTVVISTREALEEALQEDDLVLYITAELYLRMHGSIHGWMRSHGYSEAKPGCRGVFFVKTQGVNSVDPRGCELYDPFAAPGRRIE